MTQNCLLRGFLIVVLSVALSMPTEAQSGGGKIVSTGTIVGAIVGVGIALVVTVIVVHQLHKRRTITGCINMKENRMSVTDDKDKRIYILAGNTAGIKPGERITLQGKKGRPEGIDKTLVWEAQMVTKDLGVCPR